MLVQPFKIKFHRIPARVRVTALQPRLPRLTVLVMLSVASMAQAISVNDKVAADAGGMANYWDRANTMPSVVSIYSPDNGSGCTGTLINSRTVLSAAHCFIDEKGNLGSDVAAIQIRFSPQASMSNVNDRAISGVAVHPLYRDGNRLSAGGDIALLSLAAPVTTVPVIQLMSAGSPQPKAGSLVMIAGYGYAANGSETDIVERDGRRRIAHMNLGKHEKEAPTDFAPVYMAEFRRFNLTLPDAFGLNKLGVPVPLDSGSGGPGDSGGPLFLVLADGSLRQIGTVLGTNSARDGGYGIINIWTDTVWYNNWLDENNPLRTTSMAAGSHAWSDAAAWTDTLGRHDVPINAAGNVSSGRGASGRYYQVKLTRPGTLTVDMNARIDTLRVAQADATLDIASKRTLSVVTDTQLQNGKIVLTGALDVASFGMTGGQLSGTGRLTATNGVAFSGGVITPGTATAAGKLTIVGNYVQSASATLAVRMADQLEVTGATTLLGGTALIMAGAESSGLQPGRNYQFLTANGGLTGNFSRVGTDLAFLAPQLSVAPTSASFLVQRNTTPFAAAANNNSAGVARAIDMFGWNSALYRNVVSSNATQATRKFALLSGESFASTSSVTMDQSRYLRDILNTRLQRGADTLPALSGINTGEDTPTATGTSWAQVAGSRGRIAGENAMAAIDTASSMLTVGIERQFSGPWLGGVALSVNRSNSSSAEMQASTSIDSYSLGLYAGTSVGPWQFHAGTAGSQQLIKSRRALVLPGYADTLTASYRARTAQLFGEIGYVMHINQIKLEPFVNLAVAHTASNTFREDGGEAALAGRNDANTVRYGSAGLRASSRVETEAAGTLAVMAGVGWQRVIGNATPSSQLALRAGGAAFAVNGAALTRDSIQLEGGLAMAAGKSSRISLVYSSQWARRAQNQTLQAQWRHQF